MREGLDQFSSWSLKANQDGGKRWLIGGKPGQIKERTYSKAIEWKKKTWEHDRPRRRGEAAADADEEGRHSDLIGDQRSGEGVISRWSEARFPGK